MYIVTCTCSSPCVLAQERGPERSPFLSATLRGFLLRPGWEGSHMYTTVHSTCDTFCDQLGDPNGPLFTLRYYRCSPLRPVRGPERSPFFYTACVRHFTTSTWSPEQERITALFLDPGSTLLYIFFKKPPVASYSNPKKSQSRRLLHSCIVLCVLHMFYAKWILV